MLVKLLMLFFSISPSSFALNCPTVLVNDGWLAYAVNGSIANNREYPPETHLKINCFNEAPVTGFYQAVCGHDGEWYPELGKCGDDTVCGTRPHFPRIFGGTSAKQGEFPWMASLSMKPNSHICGASIINNVWLLTAAHCVYGETISRLEATMGTVSLALGSYPGSKITVAVSHYIWHPKYNSTEFISLNTPNPSFLDNDFALLKLSRPLVYNDFVRPICLPVGLCDANSDTRTASNEYDSCRNGRDEMATAGWGNITNRILPDDLYKINVTLRPRSFCYDNQDNQPSKICASGAANGQSICNGDSGGPLMCFKNERAYQLGVNSGVILCGSDEQIFARLCYVMPWIQQVMSGNITLFPIRATG